uniref:Uncharacterized protein n=1 Tax=Trichogramma kaykai TaxID=54128 RepID=A0ABD2X2M4_9HYME
MIQTKEEKMLASASARLTVSTFIFNKRANAAKSNKAENTTHEQQKQQHYHHHLHHHYHYRAAAATAAAAEKNQCGTRRAVVATTQPMALYMQIAKLLRIPGLSLYNISPNKRKMSDSPGKSAAFLQYTAHTTSARVHNAHID